MVHVFTSSFNFIFSYTFKLLQDQKKIDELENKLSVNARVKEKLEEDIKNKEPKLQEYIYCMEQIIVLVSSIIF